MPLPATSMRWSNSGNVLKLLERNDEAVAVFDRALSLKPDLAEAALKRAYVQMAREDHAASLKDFERVLSLEPGRGEAALGRVSALVSLKRFDEALTGIDGILAARPGDSDAAVARCQILTELDRPAEALDLAEGLLGRGLGGSKAEIVRAVALWRLKRRAEAIAVGGGGGSAVIPMTCRSGRRCRNIISSRATLRAAGRPMNSAPDFRPQAGGGRQTRAALDRRSPRRQDDFGHHRAGHRRHDPVRPLPCEPA